MTVSFIRALFVLLAMILGFQLGPLFVHRPEAGLVGSGIGASIAAVFMWIEASMAKVSLRGLSAAVFGLLMALLVSKFLMDAVDLALVRVDPLWAAAVKLMTLLVLSYFGMVFGMRGRDEFSIIIPYVKLQRQNQMDSAVILDTSVIIDGRIGDIARTHFLEGYLVVPKFVLEELQRIADSSDALKRAKGRRGLDILNALRKDEKITLKIHEEDFSEPADVDGKILKLAKLIDARVLTNDYNLNKVAQLQDITVLNLNDLTNALRPIVLPGEKLDVHLSKEGKEHDQALAYLPDGTMIVVEHGRRLIGQNTQVVVTSVLQTSAGKMIFAKLEAGA